MISARLWRNYFRSDPAIAGKTVRINRHALTIAGVVPAEFRGTSPVMQYDLWVPVTMGVTLGLLPKETFDDRDNRGMLAAICRLRPGVSIEQARSEAASLAASLAAANPKTNRVIGATMLPTWEEHNGVNEYLRAPLTILLAVSFVVLLIVCANVANLLLARSVGRQREFGIRFALGAGRARVARQVLTETLVLALGGAAIGVLILMWMQGSLVAMVPSIGFPITYVFRFERAHPRVHGPGVRGRGADLGRLAGAVRVPLQPQRSSERRQPQRYRRRGLAPHAQPARDRRSRAGHGGAGGRGPVRS